MKNLEGKHDKNDKWLKSITIEQIKQLTIENRHDNVLGKKVRDLFWNDTKVNKPEESNIFGKISGDKYKELIEGYQSKKGGDFVKWYDNLPNEEKIFLSDLFD